MSEQIRLLNDSYSVTTVKLEDEKDTELEVLMDSRGYLVTDPYKLMRLVNTGIAYSSYCETGKLPNWFERMNHDE